MPEALKVLAQANPAATTSTNLYTVPALTNTSISSITVCNRSATPTTFRISVAIAGAVLADTQYIYFDQAIDGNSTFIATIGITLNAADIVRVFAGAATLTFIAFGVEVS
jgi:hypothetical protein